MPQSNKRRQFLYATNPEFRERKKRISSESQKRNKDRVNSYHRSYYQEYFKLHPEKKIARRLRQLEWEEKNKEKALKYRNQWQKEKRRTMRLEAIKVYGGKCKCCGEINEVFLAFDHINGGGTQHQKELAKKGMNILLWIFKNNYPDTIQLLCHNCNYAKHRLGKCIH